MKCVKCKTCRHESIVNEQDEFYRCNSYDPYNELNASIPKCSIRCIRCNTLELYVKAVAMLEKLIEKNNNLRALNELAICYVLDRGVKQDKDKAFCLYEKAAKK